MSNFILTGKFGPELSPIKIGNPLRLHMLRLNSILSYNVA